MAESAKASDLVLEVTVSGLAATGTVDRNKEPETLPLIVTVLHIPDSNYTTEFRDLGQRFWKDKAARIADQFMKWVSTNRGQLQRR